MRTLHFVGASAVTLALGASTACSSNNTNSGPTGSGGQSSSNGTGGASSPTTSTTGSTGGTGGAGGTGGSTTGTGGSGCTGATPVALTVKNYLAWCSVSVDGNTASAADEQTVCVASGKKVALTATPVGTFILGN